MRFFFALIPLLTLGADSPPPPVELPGPLVLAGAGELSKDVRDAFLELAGKDKARIVLVSTAPVLDKRLLKEWHSHTLLAADRTRADDPAFVKGLKDATGVWLADDAGQGAHETLLGKTLHALHRNGVVIGGQAGGVAAIGRLGLTPGLAVHAGVPDGDRSLPGVIGVGLDPGSAVIAAGRTLRIVGENAVTVSVAKGAGRPAASTRMKAGDLLDLVQLRRMAANRAAKAPFPPAAVADPVVGKGSLLIVGGGGAGPEIWSRFLDLAGGSESLIVLIPTAQEDPLARRHPEEAALRQHGAKNAVVLHTRDRKTADDPKFSEVLTRAKGVWFGGGRQWRFVDAYEGTLTEKRCHDVLARGGVIGGSSAGASIQGEYMPRGHPLGNTVVMAEGYERGFGFLPGAAVDQHFFARKRTADMTALMEAYPQYLGVGIDEGTALVVRGREAAVIGQSKAAFYDYRRGRPKGEKDFVEVKAGGKYDLKARKAVDVPVK